MSRILKRRPAKVDLIEQAYLWGPHRFEAA
jgi:hypothetical protein